MARTQDLPSPDQRRVRSCVLSAAVSQRLAAFVRHAVDVEGCARRTRETCALVFGRRSGSVLVLDDLEPLPNRAFAPNRFRVPLDDLVAPSILRGRLPLALFHSHPQSIVASPSDIRSIRSTHLLWLIGVPRNRGALRLRAYASDAGKVHVVPIEREVCE